MLSHFYTRPRPPAFILTLPLTGKYWLHQALSSFGSSLEQIGSHLVFVNANGEGENVGSSLRALRELLRDTGARTVLANSVYEPWLKERDDEVASALQKDRIKCMMFHSYCVRDPYSVSTEGVGLRGLSQLDMELVQDTGNVS